VHVQIDGAHGRGATARAARHGAYPASGDVKLGCDSANSALALHTSDGSTLWHSGIGRVGNSPITYELDGRQYVLFGGGSVLYAFALP